MEPREQFERIYIYTEQFEGGLGYDKFGLLTWKGIAYKYNPDFDGWPKIHSVIDDYFGERVTDYSIISRRDFLKITSMLKEYPKLNRQTVDLFYNRYFLNLKIHMIQDDNLAFLVFDMAVHAGPKAIEVLQVSVNIYNNATILETDGKMGPHTAEEVNKIFNDPHGDTETLFRIFVGTCFGYYIRGKAWNDGYENNFIRRKMSSLDMVLS